MATLSSRLIFVLRVTLFLGKVNKFMIHFLPYFQNETRNKNSRQTHLAYLSKEKKKPNIFKLFFEHILNANNLQMTFMATL